MEITAFRSTEVDLTFIWKNKKIYYSILTNLRDVIQIRDSKRHRESLVALKSEFETHIYLYSILNSNWRISNMKYFLQVDTKVPQVKLLSGYSFKVCVTPKSVFFRYFIDPDRDVLNLANTWFQNKLGGAGSSPSVSFFPALLSINRLRQTWRTPDLQTFDAHKSLSRKYLFKLLIGCLLHFLLPPITI